VVKEVPILGFSTGKTLISQEPTGLAERPFPEIGGFIITELKISLGRKES